MAFATIFYIVLTLCNRAVFFPWGLPALGNKFTKVKVILGQFLSIIFQLMDSLGKHLKKGKFFSTRERLVF